MSTNLLSHLILRCVWLVSYWFLAFCYIRNYLLNRDQKLWIWETCVKFSDEVLLSFALICINIYVWDWFVWNQRSVWNQRTVVGPNNADFGWWWCRYIKTTERRSLLFSTRLNSLAPWPRKSHSQWNSPPPCFLHILFYSPISAASIRLTLTDWRWKLEQKMTNKACQENYSSIFINNFHVGCFLYV